MQRRRRAWMHRRRRAWMHRRPTPRRRAPVRSQWGLLLLRAGCTAPLGAPGRPAPRSRVCRRTLCPRVSRAGAVVIEVSVFVFIQVWCAAAVCSRTSSAMASAEASVSACAALQQPERALGQRESTPLSAPLSIWSCHSRSPLAASRRGLLVFSVEDPHLERASRRDAWRLLRLLSGLGYDPRHASGSSGRRLTGTVVTRR